MKLKKAVRKIVALGTGVTMLGATLFGATAADLGNYPSPMFIKDGQFSGNIVVGESAKAADVIGAVDIATSLQAAAVKKVPISGGSSGTTVVSDGEVEDEIYVGEDRFASGATYDDGDISVLRDSSVRYAGTTENFEEKIMIDSEAFTAVTGEDDEDYETDVHLKTEKHAISYVLDFDDPVEWDDEETLDLEVLGEDFTITEVKDSDTVTLSATKEEWLSSGEEIEVTVDGQEYTIKNAGVYGDNDAMVDVNGVQVLMNDGGDSDGDVEDFDYDNFELELENVANDDGTENDLIKISYGSTVSEDATDLEAAEMLGYGDDVSEAEWVWDIDANSTHLNHIGVTYNFDREDVESELNEDWMKPALMAGDSIEFPNEFAQIEFAQVQNMDHENVWMETDKDMYWASDDSPGWIDDEDGMGLELRADSDIISVEVDGDSAGTYEEVYINYNGSDWLVGGDDGSSKDELYEGTDLMSDVSFGIEDDNGEVPINIALNGGDEIDTVTIGGIAGAYNSATPVTKHDGDLVWDINWGEDDEDNAENDDLKLDGDSIGGKDYDILTHYGVIINDPENGLESGYGSLDLDFPTEAITYDLAITADDVNVDGGDSGSTADQVQPISVGTAMFAKDVGSLSSQNLIVVGGPCVNDVAAQLMGNPADCTEGFEEGKAFVKLYENGDKVAMLVAGAEALDTRRAARVVANYDEYQSDFSGKDEVVVSGQSTSFSDTVVSAPTSE